MLDGFREMLREQGMPAVELQAILRSDDPVIVRRYLELHRERLEERLAEGANPRAARAAAASGAGSRVSRRRIGHAAMPLKNRVTPFGELIADPARGLVYGNRGCLHDDAGRIHRRHAGTRWIACRLRFRDWHRTPLLQPGRFTELLFLDEATALAAGHRPCALCRREDYVRFTTIWRSMHPAQVGADAMDAQLQAERVDPATRGQRRHASSIAELPEGAFVVDDEDAYLVAGDRMLRWTPSGYVAGRSRPPRGHVTLLTPPSLVGILRTGWRSAVPFLHPSARDPRPG